MVETGPALSVAPLVSPAVELGSEVPTVLEELGCALVSVAELPALDCAEEAVVTVPSPADVVLPRPMVFSLSSAGLLVVGTTVLALLGAVEGSALACVLD